MVELAGRATSNRGQGYRERVSLHGTTWRRGADGQPPASRGAMPKPSSTPAADFCTVWPAPLCAHCSSMRSRRCALVELGARAQIAGKGENVDAVLKPSQGLTQNAARAMADLHAATPRRARASSPSDSLLRQRALASLLRFPGLSAGLIRHPRTPPRLDWRVSPQ